MNLDDLGASVFEQLGTISVVFIITSFVFAFCLSIYGLMHIY